MASHLWPLAEEPNPLQPLARTLFHEGYAGVSFFFMLSGFILSHTYQAKLTSGTISRGKYLALRLARIAPLHWLCGLPLAIWALATVGASSLPMSVTNLALLQSWVPQVKWYFSLNEPSWSLSDELFFYTMFAGLAFLSLRRLAGFGALLLLANTAMVLWLVTHGQGAISHDVPDGESSLTRTHWLTYIAPLPRLLDFVGGMLVYRAPKLRLGRRGASLLEAGAIALLLAAMVAYPLLGLADVWRMQLAYLPFMALMIWSFGTGGGALSGFLARNATLVLLGDAVHATTPHLASGAGMAVESGVVLAEELARAATAEEGLLAYQTRRFPRCKDVIDSSVSVGALQLAHGEPHEHAAILEGALARLNQPF